MKKVVALLLACFLLLAGCDTLPTTPQEPEHSIAEMPSHPASTGQNGEHTGQDGVSIPDISYVIDPQFMKNATPSAGWVYFLYPLEYIEEPFFLEDAFILFRQKEDGSALSRLSSMQCTDFIMREDGSLFFLDSDFAADHKHLYTIDQTNEPQLLAENVSTYQFVDSWLYYTHNYDTVGVGIEGHSLHRIDVDGSHHRIAAYSVNGLGFGAHTHDFTVEDGYAYFGKIKVELGDPTDGTERVEIIGELATEYSHLYSDGYVYYGTNKLIKATPDGREQIILDDGTEESWITVTHIDEDSIYYSDSSHWYYKIRKDGAAKEAIEQSEVPFVK